jgi:acyl-CoA oxidase
MTELGHGSNVQGIGTVAVYDKATGEFVINTPTDVDRKWWIGHAGTCTALLLRWNTYNLIAFLLLLVLSQHTPRTQWCSLSCMWTARSTVYTRSSYPCARATAAQPTRASSLAIADTRWFVSSVLCGLEHLLMLAFQFLHQGLNGVDNGWMKFTNVRIPRENLLNRFADVQPDGQYVSSVKNPRTSRLPCVA